VLTQDDLTDESPLPVHPSEIPPLLAQKTRDYIQRRTERFQSMPPEGGVAPDLNRVEEFRIALRPDPNALIRIHGWAQDGVRLRF
jgi:hypothetical protein